MINSRDYGIYFAVPDNIASKQAGADGNWPFPRQNHLRANSKETIINATSRKVRGQTKIMVI